MKRRATTSLHPEGKRLRVTAYSDHPATTPMGDEQHYALGTQNVLEEITKYFNVPELYHWSLVNKLTHKVAKEFFHGVNGIRMKVWNFVEHCFTAPICHILEEFQDRTGAALSGSLVLKMFTDDDWQARDLDILVVLNEENVQAFVSMISDLRAKTRVEEVRVHDSLQVKSRQLSTAPAVQIPSPPVQYRPGTRIRVRPEPDPERESEKALFKTLNGYLNTISGVQDSYDYQKHVRGIYYSIEMAVGNLDVIFLPEADTKVCGGLVQWIKLNFDYQICANAILPRTAYCLAPHEIASRKAFLRVDQYCQDCDETDPSVCDESTRWEHSDEVCDCANIVPRRVAKYRERGYNVEAGTHETYQALQLSYHIK